MNIFVLVVVGVIAGFLLLEGSLRLLFGLGDPPLYQADQEIGYLLAPQQRLRRFGRRIEINQYSLRNGEIVAQKPESTLRILLLGDSIANGGWWTDQSRTISNLIGAQLMQQLELTSNSEQNSVPATTTSLPATTPATEPLISIANLSPNIETVEVLNASANSWGPRHQLAYLQRFGTFDAQVIILLLNTDDLFATRPTPLPVGNDPNYPDHKPNLAVVELYHYFQPPSPEIPGLAEIQQEKGDRVGQNLAAIAEIQAIAQQANAHLAIAITPLLREVIKGPRDYEHTAKQRLLDFTQTRRIPFHDFLATFQAEAEPTQLYRDSIHLSPQGDRRVSQYLSRWLFAP